MRDSLFDERKCLNFDAFLFWCFGETGKGDFIGHILVTIIVKSDVICH